MKVLLVNPQLPYNAPPEDMWIKLGLASISASLRANGFETSLLDFRMQYDMHDSVSVALCHNADAICITAFTSEKDTAIEFARRIRQFLPDIPIVIGGIHASIAPADYVQTGLFDLVFQGEAEKTLPGLLLLLSSAAGRRAIVLRGETPDLNSIPFPHRELWWDYQDRIKHTPVGWGLKPPFIEFIMQRGCGSKCRFCCGPGEQGHFQIGIRRSVENAIQELQELDSKYHFKSIQFHDDQFIQNPEWTSNFCDAIIDAGLDGKQWWCGSRADVILRNKPLVLKMQKAGLDLMSVGFESFSTPLLNFWNKGTTVNQNFEAADFLKMSGIRIFSNTIMGAPREDGKWYIEDDYANIAALKKIRPDVVSWSIFTPVPGSDLYQWAFDKGIATGSVGDRCAGTDKIKGINHRQIRVMMDEVMPAANTRPFYHNWNDRFQILLGR